MNSAAATTPRNAHQPYGSSRKRPAVGEQPVGVVSTMDTPGIPSPFTREREDNPRLLTNMILADAEEEHQDAATVEESLLRSLFVQELVLDGLLGDGGN
jgi:hypothetical protein